MNSTLLLLICVGGIYSSFLLWGLFQEQFSLSTLQVPLVQLSLQSFLAMIAGTAYLKFQHPSKPLVIRSKALWLNVMTIALAQSIAAPLSYQAMSCVSYTLYLLAKSCKLIPLLTVHYVLYGTIYPKYKYFIALVVTVGVVTFTLSGSGSKSKSLSADDNQVYGLIVLAASLLLDAYVNSSQDSLFKKFKSITGAHLMIYLNCFTMVYASSYALLFTTEFQDTWNNYSVLNGDVKVMFYYSLCGAIGQIFIFLTLENFSSVVLVTVNVTRKIISMALSVVIFGHHLGFYQWLGVLLVFVGVFLESAWKFISKPQTPKNQAVDPKKLQ